MRRRERRRDGKPPKQLNPLKAAHSDLLSNLSSDWILNSFTDVSKPFIMDIGCGEGEWLVDAAAMSPEYNYLGLEIRYEALIVGAKKYGDINIVINGRKNDIKENKTETNAIRNIGFIHANILSGDLHYILNALRHNSCSLCVAAVQFPDPHWKGKHKKRRILTPSLLRAVGTHLDSEGIFYVQSDVEDVVKDVRRIICPVEEFKSEEPCSSSTSSSIIIGCNSSSSSSSGCGAYNIKIEEHEDEEFMDDIESLYLEKEVCSDSSLYSKHRQDSMSALYDVHVFGAINSQPPDCEEISRATRDEASAGTRDMLRNKLPRCFTEIQTERAVYVSRQHKPVYHLLSSVSDFASLKSLVMKNINSL